MYSIRYSGLSIPNRYHGFEQMENKNIPNLSYLLYTLHRSHLVSHKTTLAPINPYLSLRTPRKPNFMPILHASLQSTRINAHQILPELIYHSPSLDTTHSRSRPITHMSVHLNAPTHYATPQATTKQLDANLPHTNQRQQNHKIKAQKISELRIQKQESCAII